MRKPTAVLAWLLASCGDSGNPPPTGPSPSIASIRVEPAEATLAPQQTVQLTATPKDGSGKVLSGLTIAWSSSATAVATVSSGGLVTAVGPGNATVTATSGGRQGAAVITVIEVAGLRLFPAYVSVLTGEGYRFLAFSDDGEVPALAWSATGGSITGTRDTVIYTAPPGPGTYTITAVSTADPVRRASATIEVRAREAGPVEGPGGLALIETALLEGRIDVSAATLYKAYAAFGDPRLPAEYRGAGNPRKEVPREVFFPPSEVSAEVREQLKPFQLPPATPGSWYHLQWSGGSASPGAAAPGAGSGGGTLPTPDMWWEPVTSPSGRIKVWWDVARVGDGGRANVIAAEADRIWDIYRGLLGVEPPSDWILPDDISRGEAYDIYLTPLGDMGQLVPSLPYDLEPGNPCPRMISHIRLNRDKSDEDLKLTLAHELFHAVQYARQSRFADCTRPWLFEATAVWAEDHIYPVLDSEFEYSQFLANHHREMARWDAGVYDFEGYAAWPFFMYLSRQYAPRRIGDILAALENLQPYAAIDAAVPFGFAARFKEFALLAANAPPYTPFRDWNDMSVEPDFRDLVTKKPESPAPIDLLLPAGAPERELRPAETSINPAAIEYYLLSTRGSSAGMSVPEFVRINNPLWGSLPAYGAIQLLYRNKDKNPEFNLADLSGLESMEFCRLDSDEDFDQFLLIVSNGDTEGRALPAFTEPVAVARNSCGPRIDELLPTSTKAGSAAFTITVAGKRFANGARVRWNGANRPTTFVSDTELRAEISAADVLLPGEAEVTVAQPSSGGERVSNGARFTIKDNVEFRFCGVGANPAFFAYQDGNGDWKRVAGRLENGVYLYSFTLTQGRGGAYYVIGSGAAALVSGPVGGNNRSSVSIASFAGSPAHRAPARAAGLAQVSGGALASSSMTHVWYLTTEQMIDVGSDLCRFTTFDPGRRVGIVFRGLPKDMRAAFALGGTTIIGEGSGLALFHGLHADGVRSGVIDVIGSRSPVGPAWTPDRVIKITDIDPASTSNNVPGNPNFLGTEAQAPEAATLSLQAPGPREHATLTRYYTRNGFVGDLWPFSPLSSDGQSPVFGLPPSLVGQSDVHEIYSFFRSAGAQTDDEFQIEASYVRQLGDLAQRPLDPIGRIEATLLNQAARLYAVDAEVPAAADKFMSVDLVSGGVAQSLLRSTEYAALASMAGGGGSAGSLTGSAIAVPDLRALPGFPLGSLLPGGETSITVEANGWSGAQRGFLFPKTPPAGLRQGRSIRTIRVTTP